MKLRSLTSRVAVAGATTALMAGGLVAATGTAANAVDNTTAYSCNVPTQGASTWNLTISTPVIPATATAGQSFPGGLLSLTATLQIPSPTGKMLSQFGVDHADANDYAVHIGSTAIGAPISFDEVVVNEDGSATETIEVRAPGGVAEAYLTGEAGRPGVLFYIDAIGLRPALEARAPETRLRHSARAKIGHHMAMAEARPTGMRRALAQSGPLRRARDKRPRLDTPAF